MSYIYVCDSCYGARDSKDMDSMICDCGGYMNGLAPEVKTFKPFYSNECKAHISSYKQMHSEYKKKGLVPLDDVPGFRKKMDDVRKNKEDIKKSRYAKSGLKYKPGSNTRFDDVKNRFVRNAA